MVFIYMFAEFFLVIFDSRYSGLEVTLSLPCERILIEGRKVLSGFSNYKWKILQSQPYYVGFFVFMCS